MSPDFNSFSLAERLERGELAHFPACPFLLPEGDDRIFLCGQHLSSSIHKNISFAPTTGKVTGFSDPKASGRLKNILTGFSASATGWLADVLPRYAHAWRLDRVSFRPEEEATRRLRFKARNDLLHVDAFPSRPTQGYRILRLYVNLHPTDPRVWATSDTFKSLLDRFGQEAGLPIRAPGNWARRLGRKLLGLFHPGRRRRTAYDWFMLRFHDFLKGCDGFQERGRKRFWSFPPASAWLLFSDTLSHADLRGRCELDQSYFVAPQTLLFPEESPAALLERACGLPVLQRAA